MNDHAAWRGEQAVKNSSTLAQRTVEKQLAIRIKNVKNEIGDGDIAQEFGADFFPPKALLECAEGKGASWNARVTRIPRDDFAVQDRIFRQPAKGHWQFRKGLRDFIASSRKNTDFTPADMRLGADAIVLVFNRCILKIAQGFFGRFDRARKHEVDGMEKPKACFGKLARRRQPQSFANIAEQHVRALDFAERRFERSGDRFLNETLFQTDAKVSADDLHDVLGFERSGSL